MRLIGGQNPEGGGGGGGLVSTKWDPPALVLSLGKPETEASC